MTTTTTRLGLESFLRIPEQKPPLEFNPDGSIQQKMWLRTNLHGASRLPDVAFYLKKPRASRRKHALVAADLSVEILSPSDDLEQQQDKCRWYVREGGSAVLLVDPESRTIQLFTPTDLGPRTYMGDTVLEVLGELLPGMRLTPDRVFDILDR